MHAYLILAHNNWDLLQILIRSIDDVRNEIFLHIDAKVQAIPEFKTEKSQLHLLEKRVDVRWGDLSVVEAELALYEAARETGDYDYYHLLSGVDLPIKSQDYIHSFFRENAGKEFLGYTLTEITPELRRKVHRWHLFPKDFKGKSAVKKVLRAGYLRLQEVLGIERNKGIDFKKGSQWGSITQGMVDYILENKAWIRKTFTHTFCADEVYKQTLCWNSPYRKNIYCTDDDARGCMRAIGWENGTLKDWGSEDYEKLKSSPALFARKFNMNDICFIHKIEELGCLS